MGIGTTTPSLFALQVAGNIGPDAADAYDLGSASREWNNLYVKNVTVTGNISQTGSGTLSTGTGNVSLLNGATSVTGTNTFTVGTGATTLGGTLGVTGVATFNGGATVARGKHLQH